MDGHVRLRLPVRRNAVQGLHGFHRKNRWDRMFVRRLLCLLCFVIFNFGILRYDGHQEHRIRWTSIVWGHTM